MHGATPVVQPALSAFCAPFAVNNHSAGVRATAAAAAAYKQTGCSSAADAYRAGHQASCDYSLMWWHGNDGLSSQGCRKGRLEPEHRDKRGRRRRKVNKKKKACNFHVHGARTCTRGCAERKKKKERSEALLTAEERKFLELNSRGSWKEELQTSEAVEVNQVQRGTNFIH